VWTVATQNYKGAHFATFPKKLIEPCILAGSRVGDTVLDPFNGSGTTGAVAVEHGRNYVGIELNPAYIELAKARIEAAQAQGVLVNA
jgi:DNA modification methylase